MVFLTKNNFIRILFLLVVLFSFSSCEPDEETFSLNIEFKHLINDQEIIYGNDNMIYDNNTSNTYSVRRLLYVLTDITLYFADGSNLLLDDFLFINTDDSGTIFHTIDNLPALCSGISFRLGFSSENNIDNAYVNASDNFHLSMLWPNLNGTNLAFQGGYHYMKLEGKYLLSTYYPDGSSSEDSYFYNTHTGPINGEDLSILYPEFNFTPSENIVIEMDVNNWYNNPVYMLSDVGSAIMDNTSAQNMLYQNGSDVFFVKSE